MGGSQPPLRSDPAAASPKTCSGGFLRRYWYATVTGTSELPPGVDPASVCAECGRAVVPAFGSARRILFESRMWRGQDASLLATTLHVIVTDRVRRALEQLGATNVRFLPAEAEVRP